MNVEELESSKAVLAEFVERVRYIPLRLTLSERKTLRYVLKSRREMQKLIEIWAFELWKLENRLFFDGAECSNFYGLRQVTVIFVKSIFPGCTVEWFALAPAVH